MFLYSRNAKSFNNRFRALVEAAESTAEIAPGKNNPGVAALFEAFKVK